MVKILIAFLENIVTAVMNVVQEGVDKFADRMSDDRSKRRR